MLAVLSPLDLIALAVFFGVWIGYSTLLDGRYRRPSSINTNMIRVREAWMRGTLKRGLRMMDSMLIGHTIHSASFFASTTIILLAGLIGVLGSAERIHAAALSLATPFGRGPQALFEIKVLLLIAIFVYAFFKFTWAIRQFNYFCGILGSAPEADEPQNPAMAPEMTIVLSHAVWQFNAGIRAHYFALGALGWFLHPVIFMVMTALIPVLLTRRQLYSPTQAALARYAASLDRAQLADEGGTDGVTPPGNDDQLG
ncbi:MAG: DUF599 family protein [Rhodospirillales bacterium]